jgi:subtilisin family serine protease
MKGFTQKGGVLWAVLILLFTVVLHSGEAMSQQAFSKEEAQAAAVERFAQASGLDPPQVKALDRKKYTYGGKSWWVLKLSDEAMTTGELFLVSEKDGTVSKGWDEVEKEIKTTEEGWEKIHPNLKKRIEGKGLSESMNVIVVLKDQPNVREMRDVAYAHLPSASDDKDGQGRKAALAQARQVVSSKARVFNQAHGQAEVARLIEDLCGKIILRGLLRNHVIAEVPVGVISSIAALPYVELVEPDLESQGHLDISIPTMRANLAWAYSKGSTNPYSYTDVGVMDSGVDCLHPALSCRFEVNFVSSYENYTDDNHGHGTHVSRIVRSSDATYRGVAYTSYLSNIKVAYKTSSGVASSPYSAAMSGLQ